MLCDVMCEGKGVEAWVWRSEYANICSAAERNSMRMAQLEARYMRTWVRRNRGEDNCLEGHAEPRANRVLCRFAIRISIKQD
jgi:hypothetical protein